jgi:hypothetical protein
MMEMKLNAREPLACRVNVAADVTAESLRTLPFFVEGNLRRVAVPGDFDVFLLVCVESLKVIKASGLHFPIGTQIDWTLILELASAAIIVRNVR